MTETRTPEPDNLVCNLATTLVQHIDALDEMLAKR
jgi:hypothetical protein